MKYKKLITAIILISLLIIYFWKVVFLGRVLSSADNLFSYPPYNSVAPTGWTHAPNPLLGDPTSQFYPFLYYARENIRHGHLPLWNPYIMMGAPFLADAQSAELYPINIVFYTLPFRDAFAVSAFLKLLIAGFGMFLFVDALGMEFFGSLLSAVLFMFSASNIGWLGSPQTNVSVFLPWLFFLSYKFIKTSRLKYAGWLALIISIQFLGGHPETSAFILLASSVYLLALSYWEYNDKKDTLGTVKNIVYIGVAFILGFMIASPMLLPFLTELTKSATWAYRSETNTFYLPLKVFNAFLMPNMFGAHHYDNLWGVKNFNNMESGYIGIIPLILAGIAVVRKRKDRHVLFFTVFSFGLLLIIYGIPPFFQVFNLLPFYNHMATSGLSLVFQFNMIILAGIGLDILTNLQLEQRDVTATRNINKNKPTKKPIEPALNPQFVSIKKTIYKVTGIIVLLAITSVILTIAFNKVGPLEDIIGRLYILFFIAGLFIASLYIYQYVGYKRNALIIIILLAFFNLYFFGHNYNPQVPKDWVYPQPPQVISYMQHTKDLFRFVGIGACYLSNTLMVYKISDVRGYDLPVKKRYDRFFTTLFNQQPFEYPSSGSYLIMYSNYKPNQNIFVPTKLIINIFRLINVKYLGNIGNLIYTIPDYMKRAYLAHNVILANTPEDALGLVSTDINNLLKDSVVIEGYNHTSQPACADTKQDAVQIVSYEPDRVSILTASKCPSILVLTDTYDNGWKAYVDERPVTILHANYLFRGIALAPGVHRVEFEYKPFSFKLGTILSAAALIPVIVALFL
jgi:hypothetical protein